MSTPDITPLLRWLRAATVEERERLANIANTSVSYLYQLATCQRQACGTELAIGIEDGTKMLQRERLDLAPVTVRELATMCALQGMAR